MLRSALAIILFTWLGVVWGANTPDLSRQKEQAQQQQKQLRASIKQLQAQIDSQVSKKKTADLALKESEAKISDLGRQLKSLQTQQQQLEMEIAQLTEQAQQAGNKLDASREVLASQLKAQYQSGVSPWAALLSGKDPNLIGRNLAYMAYISKAQSKSVQSIEHTVAHIENLQASVHAKRDQLSELEQQAVQQQELLLVQQEKRQEVLAKIDAELQEQRSQQQQMLENEARLGRLISEIEAEVARLAKMAEEAAAEAALEAAKKQERVPEPTQAGKPQPAEASSVAGLQKGLPKPVQGNVVGRFGAERPEGGVWRGIVLLAEQGREVRSVAAGQVVYSSWLSGFGNIIIIDHGMQYLSVYAYNHSLLKEVGDTVSAREVIATVGSTGGQVESGLYFEIRHQGKPVNPVLWLKQ